MTTDEALATIHTAGWRLAPLLDQTIPGQPTNWYACIHNAAFENRIGTGATPAEAILSALTAEQKPTGHWITEEGTDIDPDRKPLSSILNIIHIPINRRF